MQKGDGVFLIKALDKILNEKETKRSQHQHFRKVCEETLSKPHPTIYHWSPVIKINSNRVKLSSSRCKQFNHDVIIIMCDS